MRVKQQWRKRQLSSWLLLGIRHHWLLDFFVNLTHQEVAAAAAAKSLQSCPTLCDPIDGSPPGSPVPGILQARILECVAISFFDAWKWKVKVKLLSRIWLLATPWTAAYQAPPSMGFFQARVLEWGAIAFSARGYRHIYISGLAFQTEGKSIYLPLLSRVEGLPNTGKVPQNFQVVHMCYGASPMSSHASASTGKTEFCVDLYIPFGWSGTPAYSQLVLCEIPCIWRCIPDASMERGLLPFLLLLHHIVFLQDSHCWVSHVVYQKNIHDNTRTISVCTYVCTWGLSKIHTNGNT